ncbi:MAG TPA: hypothetical protein VEY08_13290, partial [Chloroflexia bacterium]|nr:hypothetical protein [Chloroflexia bacterium]
MDISNVIQDTIRRAGGSNYTRKRGTGELERRTGDPFGGEDPGRVMNRMEQLGMEEERAIVAAA